MLNLLMLLAGTYSAWIFSKYHGSDLSCPFFRRFDDETREVHYAEMKKLDMLELFSHVGCIT